MRLIRRTASKNDWAKFIFLATFLLANLAGSSRAAESSVVSDLKTLMQTGKTQEAYIVAHQHSEEYGNPDFDYLYALLAIDLDKYSEGIFALERYLIQKPEDPSGRLELARARFLSGDHLRAKAEFDLVLKLNPPDEVRQKIRGYLDAIQTLDRPHKRAVSAWLEGGLGYDTNLNGGVEHAEIVLPLFGPLEVVDDGLKKRSAFSTLNFGGEFSQPIRPDLVWLVSGQVDGRFYDQNSTFDQLNGTVATGLGYLDKLDSFKTLLIANKLQLDDNPYRSVYGLSGEWRHLLDQQSSFLTAVQLARLDYAENNKVRDSNFLSGSLGYRYRWEHPWQPALSIIATLGREANREQRDDLGREMGGIGAELNFSPREKWLVNATLSYQKNNYRAEDPILNFRRLDHFYSANLGATFQIDRAWSVGAEFHFMRNDSNLALYDYRRNQAQLKVRYDWN